MVANPHADDRHQFCALFLRHGGRLDDHIRHAVHAADSSGGVSLYLIAHGAFGDRESDPDRHDPIGADIHARDHAQFDDVAPEFGIDDTAQSRVDLILCGQHGESSRRTVWNGGAQAGIPFRGRRCNLVAATPEGTPCRSC